MNLPPAVVIGASAGGVAALFELTAGLPPGLPAIMAIVLHVGNGPSMLPALINRRSTLPALHPREGEIPEPGKIYVAPPDHHLLLHPEGIRLSRGARENHTRPAIDPLFRTAAIGWGSQAIGVVLTGNLDDGTAGLAAIKECGGTAIVQDPATAAEPGMPASALAHVPVDHCVPLDRIAALIGQLVQQMPAGAAVPQAPERLLSEQAVFEGAGGSRVLDSLGGRSRFACPDCGGNLWELDGSRPPRYRCHIGHGYSGGSLELAQADTLDQSLAASLRLLREREMLLRRHAQVAETIGEAGQAQAGRSAADRVGAQVQQLQQLMAGPTGGS